jgi:hypothetical protein
MNKDPLNDISIHTKGSIIERQFQEFQAMVAAANGLNLGEAALVAKLEQVAREYALEHNNSCISAFALFWYEKNCDKLPKLFGSLSPSVRNS